MSFSSFHYELRHVLLVKLDPKRCLLYSWWNNLGVYVDNCVQSHNTRKAFRYIYTSPFNLVNTLCNICLKHFGPSSQAGEAIYRLVFMSWGFLFDEIRNTLPLINSQKLYDTQPKQLQLKPSTAPSTLNNLPWINKSISHSSGVRKDFLLIHKHPSKNWWTDKKLWLEFWPGDMISCCKSANVP